MTDKHENDGPAQRTPEQIADAEQEVVNAAVAHLDAERLMARKVFDTVQARRAKAAEKRK